MICMKSDSSVWHPNTQMSEWTTFPKIISAKGMWLYDSKGGKMLDGVASMWCNVWGHSKSELVSEIIKQTKIIQHTPLFNLTHPSAEKLSKKLLKLNPKMKSVFFSDNGSTAMEIAIKIALQYWHNVGENKKTNVATLENGYHGDTFGAMSVGYVPEFFSKFRSKLFSTIQFPVPRTISSGTPKKTSSKEYEEYCLSKIEDKLEKLLNDEELIFGNPIDDVNSGPGGVDVPVTLGEVAEMNMTNQEPRLFEDL